MFRFIYNYFARFPYRWGMLAIFLLSLTLRFWGLARFNTLVFDEVYYAKYANYYLLGKDFFNSHPPLSQYLIAFSIWLGSFLPADSATVNNLTESARSTFSYRWFNALSGSFLPLVVGAIAYQLKPRLSFSLLASFLLALDGLFLVESRYALNNIYLVLFGLLGHLCFLLAVRKSKVSLLCLLLSGVAFGCSVAVKWNGLGFWLGLGMVIAIASVLKYYSGFAASSLLQKFTRVKPIFLFIFLGFIPAFTYSLLWFPHLQMNPDYNFWQVHQKIASFHQAIGSNDSNIHPYCSPWYSWLVLWRPIAYYYQRFTEDNTLKIHTVYALGNPILWWLSTLAIIVMLVLLRAKLKPNNYFFSIYILCNYAANLLPWLKITRCTFIYHYMGSYTFAILALAYLFDELISGSSSVYKISMYFCLGLIVSSFIYWLPIFLGLPISEDKFREIMLFDSWI